jgi:hypothetical protein
MKKKKCAYEGVMNETLQAFHCPTECSGKITVGRRNFYLGEARKRHGPDMMLCEAHNAWYNGRPERRLERMING